MQREYVLSASLHKTAAQNMKQHLHQHIHSSQMAFIKSAHFSDLAVLSYPSIYGNTETQKILQCTDL